MSFRWELWDAWRTAPRTELLPIKWPKGSAPTGQGPISQIELLYRSDVGRRLEAILRRHPPHRSATT